MTDEILIDIAVDELPMSPADLEMALEAEKEARIQHLADLLNLARRLASKRDESIKAKRPIEKMMTDSLRLYEGWDGIDEPTKNAPAGGTVTRTPTPHLLRARTDRWEARICDMLSANPWGIEPEGQDSSRIAADGMTKRIKDQLNYCRFDRTLRRISRDTARLGWGLSIGPMATERRVRRYVPPVEVPPPMGMPGEPQMMGGGSTTVIEETVVPEIREGDPWCFFPDMVDRVEKAEFAHYVHLMGALEVRNLAPGFDEEQINALLRKEPDLGELRVNIVNRMKWLGDSDSIKNKYAVWQYTGLLEKKDLETLGLVETETEDELGNSIAPPMAMVDLWYCQDHILKAKLSPIQDDYRIPYFVYAPFSIEGSMFGRSLPNLGEDSQIVASAAYAIALHSASVSSGPQIMMDPGVIEPADKQYMVRGPKTWKRRGDADGEDWVNAFRAITIPNVVQEALQLYGIARDTMDEELNTSQWASPETSGEEGTASGLAMMMNARSILQLMVAAAADDDLFEPIICRMIWWNNDYGDDESIKGNYLVKPTVQSERLVKDVQIQQMQSFSAFVMGDPEIRANINLRKMITDHAHMLDAPVTEWLLPEEQVAEMQANQPPDPAQELAMLKAQTENLRAQTEQIRAQTEQAKLQREMMGGQPQAAPTGNGDVDFIIAQEDNAIEREKIAKDRYIAELKAETDRLAIAVKDDQVEVARQQLAFDRQKDREADLVKEGMRVEREAQEIAVKREFGSGI